MTSRTLQLVDSTRTFGALVVVGGKRAYRYPWGQLVSVAIDPIVILGMAMMFTTLYRHNQAGQIAGYGPAEIVWYFAATTFVWYWIHNVTDERVAARVLSGDLTVDLLRPLSVLVWELGHAASIRVGGVLLEFVPALVLYSVLFRPDFLSPATMVRFMVAASMAFLLYFSLNFLIGLSGLYVYGPQAILGLKHLLVTACAGAFVPLEFLPPAVQQVLHWLPFPYLFYWPVQFFLGRGEAGTWAGFLHREAIAGLWLVALLVLCRLLWRRAVRRYAGAGG